MNVCGLSTELITKMLIAHRIEIRVLTVRPSSEISLFFEWHDHFIIDVILAEL